MVVMSPVGSVEVGPYTVAPRAWVRVNGAVRVITPPAPVDAITADSALGPPSIVIALPAVRPVRLATWMVEAPAAAVPVNVVGPPLTKTALLFSRTVFATETLPTSQPARVYVTHGAGVFFGAPLSPLTMFGVVSAGADTGAVQYLNADVKVGVPSAR
jgi:hypothetical protein